MSEEEPLGVFATKEAQEGVVSADSVHLDLVMAESAVESTVGDEKQEEQTHQERVQNPVVDHVSLEVAIVVSAAVTIVLCRSISTTDGVGDDVVQEEGQSNEKAKQGSQCIDECDTVHDATADVCSIHIDGVFERLSVRIVEERRERRGAYDMRTENVLLGDSDAKQVKKVSTH